MVEQSIKAVLFDLDGTLVDTAADLAVAVNRLLSEEGLPPVAASELRAYTSKGMRGLLGRAMNLSAGDPRYAELTDRALCHYANHLCYHSRLFDGMQTVLWQLEQRGVAWGVVTNKPSRFTNPLMDALELTERTACIVSGDTAARPKPAPDPLLYALGILKLGARECLYVGDDPRDIVAARAADIRSIAVRWGYLSEDIPIEQWGADQIIAEPAQLLACLY